MLWGAYDFTLGQFLCKWENGHWVEDVYNSFDEACSRLKDNVCDTCIITATISAVPRVVEDPTEVKIKYVKKSKSDEESLFYDVIARKIVITT